MSVQLIKIDAIRMDGGTQSRANISDEVVADYADTITGGQDLPPVTIYFDGKAYWLADGFHRTHAYIKAGAEEIEADIRQGDRREAILFSLGANKHHGLRRSDGDKRRSIERLLKDEEWAAWPQRKIADHIGVSQQYVSKIMGKSDLSYNSGKMKTVERGGKTFDMDTSNIGGKKAADEPDTSEAVTPTADEAAPDGNPEGDDTPEPVEAPRKPSPFAKLDREVLEDEHQAVMDENANLRAQLKAAKADHSHEIDRLKAHIGDLSSDNQGATISKLEKQRVTLKRQLSEQMLKTKREEYKRKKAEEERDEATRKLQEQVIPL